MYQENFYGNDGYFNRNDGNANGQPILSAPSGAHEGEQVAQNPKPETDTSFSGSNRRLDNYHLHFSSWL